MDIATELPYGLQLGEHLTDDHGLWRVDVDGLTDLAGGDDWDWQGVIANGGLGILRPIADEDGETPDSYLDGVDGHWYVCRYDRTLPQIHARDCETCADRGYTEPWCNHDAVAVVAGVCECGERV